MRSRISGSAYNSLPRNPWACLVFLSSFLKVCFRVLCLPVFSGEFHCCCMPCLQHTFPFPFGWLVESWQSCSEVIEVCLLCLAGLLFNATTVEDCRINPQPRLPLSTNHARKCAVAFCMHFGNCSPASLELEEFFSNALVKLLWYLCMSVCSFGRFLVCHLVVFFYSATSVIQYQTLQLKGEQPEDVDGKKFALMSCLSCLEHQEV